MGSLAFVRFLEAAVSVACIGIFINRYRRDRVVLMAGDMVLWTLMVFFVSSLALDAAHFVKLYSLYPGMNAPLIDPLTRALAAFGVLVAVWAVSLSIRAVEAKTNPEVPPRPIPPRSRWLWLGIALLPIAVVLLSPQPGVYRIYAAPLRLSNPGQPFYNSVVTVSAVARFNIFVTWSTQISSIGLAVWVIGRPTRGRIWILVVASISLIDLWVNGKRNILAIIAIQVAFALLPKHALAWSQVRRALAIVGMVLLGLVGFAQWYQNKERPFITKAGQGAEAFKVDFGRTDDLRLALSSSTIAGSQHALSYPGQSFILDLETIVQRGRRNLLSYEDRVTSLAADTPFQKQNGGITTSFLAEMVDNFGLYGLLLGPIVLALAIRVAGRASDPVVGLLIALSASLLLVVPLAAVLPILGLTAGRLAWLATRRSSGAKGPRIARESPIPDIAPA